MKKKREINSKKRCTIEIITPKTLDVLKGEIVIKTEFGIIVKPDTNGEITVITKQKKTDSSNAHAS